MVDPFYHGVRRVRRVSLPPNLLSMRIRAQHSMNGAREACRSPLQAKETEARGGRPQPHG
jgi:hypothetical protein